MNDVRKKNIAILLIGLLAGGLLGVGIGFSYGTKIAAIIIAHAASKFISIDYNLIEEYLYRYQNNIGGDDDWRIPNITIRKNEIG